MPTGRLPYEFTPEIVSEICERLIGGESVAAICKDEHMPSAVTFYSNMAKDDAFRTTITRAREYQQEALIDQTVDMADTATVEDWQVVKLRIWARQWRAGKLAPKKYGDKVTQEHVGGDGGPLVVTWAGPPAQNGGD